MIRGVHWIGQLHYVFIVVRVCDAVKNSDTGKEDITWEHYTALFYGFGILQVILCLSNSDTRKEDITWEHDTALFCWFGILKVILCLNSHGTAWLEGRSMETFLFILCPQSSFVKWRWWWQLRRGHWKDGVNKYERSDRSWGHAVFKGHRLP